LLRECANICHVVSDTDATYITENTAKRAYQRVVQDPFGAFRPSIAFEIYLTDFPACIEKAINSYGYIDECANQCNHNATLCFDNVHDRKLKRNQKSNSLLKRNHSLPSVKTHQFPLRDPNKSIWFMTIQNSFSDSFWDTWITSLDNLRFCKGMGGKHEAFVRCSCSEENAVFTTGGRHLYHALPMSDMEKKFYL
jgi:hypothetical protein